MDPFILPEAIRRYLDPPGLPVEDDGAFCCGLGHKYIYIYIYIYTYTRFPETGARQLLNIAAQDLARG